MSILQWLMAITREFAFDIHPRIRIDYVFLHQGLQQECLVKASRQMRSTRTHPPPMGGIIANVHPPVNTVENPPVSEIDFSFRMN